MGVPVVTLRGDRHAGRVGLTEWIAETGDAYVDTAVALAGSPDRLTSLRRELRQRMADSTLCDPETITHDVEAAYRRLIA